MSGVLARVRSLFLEAPPAVSRELPHAVAAPPVVERMAVLGAPAGVMPTGAALALVAARAARARCALLAIWGAPTPGARLPARAGAARAAAALRSRGLEATAGGRLVYLELPAEPIQAAAALARAEAAARAPAVLVVAGPRTDELDRVLVEQDLLVVLGRDDDAPTARLVAESLAELGRPIVVCPSAPGRLAGALALVGLGGGALCRPTLGPALEALA